MIPKLTRTISRVCALALLLFCTGITAQAQINYTEGFDAGAGGYTAVGGYQPGQTTLNPCTGAGSYRTNIYSGSPTSVVTSPLIGTSLGGLTTLSYQFKAVTYNSLTVAAPNTQFTVAVQYASSTSGPWTTIETINSTNHVASASCTTRQATFTPPAGALYIRFSCTYLAGDNWMYFDAINLSEVSGTACTGTPSPGTATASATAVCPSQPFTVSATGGTSGVSGLTYQLQSSPAGAGTFTNVGTSQTSPLFGINGITSSTSYQIVVTCTSAGGGSATTPIPVTVNVDSFYNCYCASNGSSVGYTNIVRVALNTLNNQSTCSQAGGPGSQPGIYANYRGLTPDTLTTGALQQFLVRDSSCAFGSYPTGKSIFIDFSGDGDYNDPGEQVFVSATTTNSPSTATGTFTVPANADLGLTGMRVITQYFFGSVSINPCGAYFAGETEDYTVYIKAGTLCTGAPTAGTINATNGVDTFCAGGSTTLNLAGASNGLGISYQFRSSTTQGGPYTNVPSGGTGLSYSTGVLPQTTYFVVDVTCSGSNTTVTTPEFAVVVNQLPSVTLTNNSAPFCAGNGSATLVAAGA
ncbi:MAG TPA: GEVED domain-containing protein, partial [Fibrella sp.]